MSERIIRVDFTDRVERAARARHERTRLAFPLRKHVPYDELHPSARQMLVGIVRQDIEAAFPELFSTPLTHWVAPLEATDAMQEAAENSLYWQDVWDAFRVTYLKEQHPS